MEDEITTEINKRIAEALGYEAGYIENEDGVFVISTLNRPILFSPETSADIREECVEKFMIDTFYDYDYKIWEAYYNKDELWVTGKSPKEAILNCLKSMFGEEG